MATTRAQPDCVFCGYRDAPIYLRRVRFEVRRCPHCSVLWSDPTGASEPGHPDALVESRRAEAATRRSNAARLAELRRHVAPASHPRLLELGCGLGDFVYQARVAGFDAHGLDPSPLIVAEANRRIPGLVRSSALDSIAGVSDASLDVIASFDAVDRLERPDILLDEVLRVLRPRGVLIVESPIQESLEHHGRFLRGRVLPDADFDVGVLPGVRPFKFGRRAWATILRDRGFELLALEPREVSIREVLEGASHHPVLRAGALGWGLLGRATGMESRALVVARSQPRRAQ